MSEATEFFLAESIAHARTLSVAQAVLYLRGMVQSCTDSEAVEHIRKAYIGLSESDRQLELIQTRQLKLKLKATGDGEPS